MQLAGKVSYLSKSHEFTRDMQDFFSMITVVKRVVLKWPSQYKV